MEQDTFAFIIHPIQIKRDVARKYPFLGEILTEPQINFFSRFFPPVYLSEVNGIISQSTPSKSSGMSPVNIPSSARFSLNRRSTFSHASSRPFTSRKSTASSHNPPHPNQAGCRP